MFIKLWGKRHAHQPVMHRTGPHLPWFSPGFWIVVRTLCHIPGPLALGSEFILVSKNSDGPTELFSHSIRNFTVQYLTRRARSCLCFSTLYVLKIYRWLIKSKSSLSSNKSKRNELLGTSIIKISICHTVSLACSAFLMFPLAVSEQGYILFNSKSQFIYRGCISLFCNLRFVYLS